MHVRFSDAAEDDLDKIHSYISKDREERANIVVDRLVNAAYQLGSFPFLGRPGRIEGTRELSVPRTSYVIVYKVPDAYHVDIISLVHTRRQWP